jgi:prolyl-tRNA synthetase
MRIIADERLRDANELVSGANADGYHYRHIDLRRDCRIDLYADVRTVQPGEPCPECGAALEVVRAIEVGHIFKLGTKYSEALGARFLDEHGHERPIVMGSYGIGVERIIAAFIEQNHDEHGICWIPAIAPYHVHLLALGIERSDAVRQHSDELYSSLWAAGVEVLYDDREESAGVKFNDADLLGLPLQLIVSARGLEAGTIELKERRSGRRHHVALAEAVDKVAELLRALQEEPWTQPAH